MTKRVRVWGPLWGKRIPAAAETEALNQRAKSAGSDIWLGSDPKLQISRASVYTRRYSIDPPGGLDHLGQERKTN
ncbi:hypothetical protein TorRG33x02_321330 [Trema orientale]|uniref:Uncharacterized protein n=1 Tax=Trema orientale TaxID=63057 RepID=A0A2P5BGV9_TREOI|nr:hypothetical protein TorRG33x02_321330 [Trema orientale]